ncbi:alpha/beta fold hydrolase [Cohnella hashimotonis]|uniref:Alpha/beta hydrolase n=1 Tax=Cohnella hashimotonis TaxID=2826895 RepID=A0ABT6TLV7_9BACL|nr:alpha/beta hydrolase [Cohnella hashimotonis]MDI4646914.1 alpha/beta hydrolase [Cohnella hashimotonis]
MQRISATSDLNGLRIHYLDTLQESDASLVPVFVCPGLSETAEEYEDFIAEMLPRRVIVLSFRGRGRSDTPLSGYDLQDHVADIESVVQQLQLTKFHLYGYSRGVSYALAYARRHPHRIASIIVQDYPAEHKAMTAEWPRSYIDEYLIPTNRLSTNIRAEAVHGIQKDSTACEITFSFEKPVLVMRGLLEDSLISDEELLPYRLHFSNLRIENFTKSGHNIRGSEKEKLDRTIKDFLAGVGEGDNVMKLS